MSTQTISQINAIAAARGTEEPSNTDVFWIDDNLTGPFYTRTKAYNKESGTWDLLSRTALEVLEDLKTVDGTGSGLDADTLDGYTAQQLLNGGGGGGSVPGLSTGQLLVGQPDDIGTAQTVGGIATIDNSGDLTYIPGTISHTGLTDVGTNTHVQIDAHISNTSNPHGVTAAQVGNTTAQWNADSIEGNLTNIGTLGAPADGQSLTWDNATSRFIMASVATDSIYTGPGTTPSSLVVTLTDSIYFEGGKIEIEGADSLGTSSNLTLFNGDVIPISLWDFRNNGDVYCVGDVAIDISGKYLEIGNIQFDDGIFPGYTVFGHKDTNSNTEFNVAISSGGQMTLNVPGSEFLNINVGNSTKQKFFANGRISIGSGTSLQMSDITLDGTTVIGNSGDSVGFYDTLPIPQPTTGHAAATFVANTSGIVDDSATWDGYTIGQIVKVLRDRGDLA